MRTKLILMLALCLFTLGVASESHALLGEIVGEILPGGDDPAPAVPEPSAALVFGAGLLVAGLASRRRRS